MHPLTKELRGHLQVFLEDETIRPESFIEFIEKQPKEPLSSLASLFNHLRSSQPKTFRLLDLEAQLERELAQRYFVQILPNKPLMLSKKCYVQLLNTDGWLHVASFLKFKSLLAYSQTCRSFRQIGLQALSCDSKNIQKYVKHQLAGAAYVPLPFAEPSYSRPYDLTLTKVRSVAAAGQFPCVQSLKILDANISQVHFTGLLASLPHLKKLYFGNLNEVTPDVLAQCAFPPSLKSCMLLGEKACDQAVRALARQCPNLEELTLHACKQLTIAAFSGKTPFCALRKLELFSARISDRDLRHILSCCPNLQSLNLNHSSNLTGSTLAEFDGLEFLKELDLQGTGISDDIFKAICLRASNLQTLNIGFCDGISVHGYEEVVYPPKLERLLVNWGNIGNRGLLRLLDTTNLKELQLTNCTKLTEALFDERPWLRNRPDFNFEGSIALNAFAADF